MALTREVFRPYTDPETFDRIREYETVTEMWAKCLADFADRPAIEDDGKSYTFAQLEQDAASVRAALSGLGLQKGDRVGLLSPNSYDFVKSYLGIVTAGYVCVALPPHLDE
ncbi:MAG: acyl--CoA ligase, partial [Lachnospiraceae bacterium]|nr:acyl--CoA ligase [Lachnospiraceae bacterium]